MSELLNVRPPTDPVPVRVGVGQPHRRGVAGADVDERRRQVAAPRRATGGGGVGRPGVSNGLSQ